MTKRLGFTLIEVLIALAIFAIIATLTSSIMYYVFNTRARVVEQAQQLVDLQLAITLMERDIAQTINRPTRGNNMQLFPAFIGMNNYLEFTRAGFANPNSEFKRSTLQRVGWVCNNSQLSRRRWASLDTVNKDVYMDKVVLNHLRQCQFAFIDQSLQVLPEWRAGAVGQNQKIEHFPKAVQLTLTINNGDNLSLLFAIPIAVFDDLTLVDPAVSP